MAEIGQASTEVYAPTTTLQVWRTLLNWMTFFVQIFVQIIRGTPSLASFINYSSPASFKPLPVVESPETSNLSSASVHIPPAVVDCDCLEKLTVVLDLDETLVCAYETSSLPDSVRRQATEAGLTWFELECVSSDKEGDGKPKVSYVTVFERPGLHEFLNQLSKFADLVLFTAGLEGYAKPLVDRIDAESRISRRLYRPSTISTEYREHVKDLSFVSKDFGRIVIVDNNPFSFLLQPVNGIPCIPFSAGQPHDDQLLEVLLPLLKQLSEQMDVRPVLYERFRMPEWFQKHGIPASGFARPSLVSFLTVSSLMVILILVREDDV
ncbi:hypothetical protein SSX86_018236 [Deinandra increscens subsp. villosa]|uniref:FCP1 homology domain-containing protein n=1 Tax=Deinandra increscens subsp. villosa TaxID=3103831 RepID=A0AAP0CS12_9ASTR